MLLRERLRERGFKQDSMTAAGFNGSEFGA